MGAFTSRRNSGVEEVDYSAGNAYRYPPKSGCYFGSYFIMGGERFDTTQPESYLFGENNDLNFLGNRPVPFPYPAPQANEPTKTLKSLVNIRKDSLRFIKVLDDVPSSPLEGGGLEDSQHKYNIEFTFDSDVRVAITIFYFASEEISGGQAVYLPRDASMNSETYRYKRGANQTFSQATHIIEPDKFPQEEWLHNPDKDTIPIVIQCVVEDEVEHVGHSHVTLAIIEQSVDGGWVLKPLKQKQMVDGLCYLLQEIYGIENKNPERGKIHEDDIEDVVNECVICMSDVRDTLILPCRHLCLCNGCADSLRYQANNCPICRAPFRALLQIRAMRKKLTGTLATGDGDDPPLSQEGVPPGYEAVALIEALNGPATSPSGGATVAMAPVTTAASSPEESPAGTLEMVKIKRRTSVRGATLREADEDAAAAAGDASSGHITPPDAGGDATPSDVGDVLSLDADDVTSRDIGDVTPPEVRAVTPEVKMIEAILTEPVKSLPEASVVELSSEADGFPAVSARGNPRQQLYGLEPPPDDAASEDAAYDVEMDAMPLTPSAPDQHTLGSGYSTPSHAAVMFEHELASPDEDHPLYEAHPLSSPSEAHPLCGPGEAHLTLAPDWPSSAPTEPFCGANDSSSDSSTGSHASAHALLELHDDDQPIV